MSTITSSKLSYPIPQALADDPWKFHPAQILERRDEVEGVITLQMAIQNEEQRKAYRFLPGQFNMLYVFGIGECPISIASSAADPSVLTHTIRTVGQVTDALAREPVGGIVGLRGPFGSHWPVEAACGKNLILVAGGIGLPPLRPVIDEAIRRRSDFERVVLVYGAKTVSDLLFTYEYDAWKAAGIELLITVDRADSSWRGERGLVPSIIKKLRLRGCNHIAMMCGPEIMMKFAAQECMNAQVPESQIYVSIERNMKCACGFCGHCQLGPEFVCKDGPVFPLVRMRKYLCREGF